MTDDDISELAEFMWQRCAEFESGGLRVLSPLEHVTATCPLEAAFGTDMPDCLTREEANGFMNGFDGAPRVRQQDAGLFFLGRRFREQALSGEGFR